MSPEEEEAKKREQERQEKLKQLKQQQQDLQQQIEQLAGTTVGSDNPVPTEDDKTQQEWLMEQLRAALGPKDLVKDPNKVLLKAMTTSRNKVAGPGGTSTLNPDILDRVGTTEFSMAEWLASLNRQDEGESEVNKNLIVGQIANTTK